MILDNNNQQLNLNVAPSTSSPILETPQQTTSSNDQQKCSTATSDQIIDDIAFSLMMLVIEGRKADSNSTRGYKEGSHVNTIKSNHQCSLKLSDVSYL